MCAHEATTKELHSCQSFVVSSSNVTRTQADTTIFFLSWLRSHLIQPIIRLPSKGSLVKGHTKAPIHKCYSLGNRDI